jgi:Tfp pilus assembly protein PilN
MRAVNLLPREPKLGRKRLSVVAQLALVAPFVVASLLTAGYLLSSAKVNDRKGTLVALQAELALLPAPPPAPKVNTELALQRDQRIAALSAALDGRLAWDRVLREISAVLPGDVWLTSLTAEHSTPPPTPPATTTTTTTTESTTTTTSTTPAPAPAAPLPPPTAGPLNVAGYTYSQEAVARLLTRLAVVPALQDVTLLSSERTTVAGRPVFTFSIKADVRSGETG